MKEPIRRTRLACAAGTIPVRSGPTLSRQVMLRTQALTRMFIASPKLITLAPEL